MSTQTSGQELSRMSATTAPRRLRLPKIQELGLLIVILILGAILSIYGWRDAERGAPNTFLNFDNLINGIATPMSYYAIMAIGVTFVIVAGGIDISVAGIMTCAAMIAAWY